MVAQRGPFTVWVDYGVEGWKPCEFASVSEAWEFMLSGERQGPFRLTKELEVCDHGTDVRIHG